MDYMLLPEAYRDNPYEDIDSCQKYYYEKYLRNLQACRKMHSKDYIKEQPVIKDKPRSKKNYKAIEDNPFREKMNRYHRNRINKNNPNYNPFESIKYDYNSFNPFKLDNDNLSDTSSITTDYAPSVLSSQDSYKPFSKKGSMTTSRAKDILSLSSDADTDKIKRQFRKKIFSNHPDKNKKNKYANLNTQEILDARRKMYSRRNSMYGRKFSRKKRKSKRKSKKCSKKKKRKSSLKMTKRHYYGKKWSNKYKKSINCRNPKGFSQRAHYNSKKKRSRRRRK